MLSENSSIVTVKEQVSCDAGGEAVILNLQKGMYYGLDSVGARVWELIGEPKTFAELRQAISKEYEVEAASLDADLRDLLDELAAQGLIEITA